MWDNHTHCCFSGDSEARPEDMVSAAKKKGLAGMTFTDHLDLDYREVPGLFDLDLEGYQKKIHHLQKANGDSEFTVLFGLELGLQPHLVKEHTRLLAQYPFDYVIGSTHVVGGVDPYYPVYFQDRTPQEAYQEYYEAILSNLLAFDHVDACGHLDYIFRYGPSISDTPDSYSPYREIIDAILEHLIQKDIALEINTGAFRCGLQQPNPCLAIIRRYHDMGGHLITLGADAHKPEHVGLAFEKLPSILRSVGFEEYAVYQRRTPHMYPLAPDDSQPHRISPPPATYSPR
jgi:histidinol-phosphatase (PHP family)